MFELTIWGWLRRDIKARRVEVDRWVEKSEGNFFFRVYFLLMRFLRGLFSPSKPYG
jgi:hypothetical protein